MNGWTEVKTIGVFLACAVFWLLGYIVAQDEQRVQKVIVTDTLYVKPDTSFLWKIGEHENPMVCYYEEER